MNTSKNNIEYQIKKQIADREITPSRDLWSEIQAHKSVESAKTKINWFLVAACLVLAFSLGAVLFFNEENTNDLKPGIAVVNKETDHHKSNLMPVKIRAVSEQKSEESVAIQKVISEEKKKAMDVRVYTEKQMPLPAEKTHEMAVNLSNIETEKIIAQSDSAKTPAKRKRYVDPSTLLFSVEHKDVIEKTKGKSNVASIDLNEK